MDSAKQTNLRGQIHWILRIACAGCFIGHGAFGIITKAEWLAFFAVVHISPEAAYQLMPLIGIMDITLGILILVRPMRFVMLWMVVWAIWTALLRPFAHMGWWEFLERAGNYGAPFCFLYLSGAADNLKSLFTKIKEPLLDQERIKKLSWYLRFFTALLLIGHGGFGAFQQKTMLIHHFQSTGFNFFNIDPILFITYFGWFEIILGLSVLIKPVRSVVLFVVFWKVSTELLYPISGAPVWEFIERFGSYGVPLALFFLLPYIQSLNSSKT